MAVQDQVHIERAHPPDQDGRKRPLPRMLAPRLDAARVESAEIAERDHVSRTVDPPVLIVNAGEVDRGARAIRGAGEGLRVRRKEHIG